MIAAQKKLVIILLFAIAWLLCVWFLDFGKLSEGQERIITLWEREYDFAFGIGVDNGTASRHVALAFGILLPVLLVALAAYLCLGWFRSESAKMSDSQGVGRQEGDRSTE